MIESSARLIVAQPMFSIVKVLSQSQPFGGFLVFLLAWAGPKLSAVALFSSVTRADAGLLTVIVKAQLPVSPFSLLATQLTVVTPAGKVEPEGGEQVMTAPSKVSLTVGKGYSTTARHLPASAFLMMLPGQMIAGGASETMTVAVAVLLAELSSGASELMVAVLLMNVPFGKGVFTVVTNVIVADAPAGSTAKVTLRLLPEPRQTPLPVAEQETNDTEFGKLSGTVTLLTGVEPLLIAVIL